MTEIRLYNTATRRKERLEPIDPDNVRMYVCGPTVYDRAHIGNARPVVVFDVLYRLLRHVYGEGCVTYVRNVTDVDDKINARATERGRPIREITEETLGWFHEDMAALGTLPPSHEPRATEFIGPMIAMIETLIAKGHAYEAQGHVLFAVASYPDYGRLARRSLDEMQAGARVEVAPYKRSPLDFVLWKPSPEGIPGWDSPWGRGRPGWHIECSAMAHELLGPSFDIHGGGIDLVFPHHENEVAQSLCAHPEGRFANVWMHNGFLNVEGEKMSKSLGNFFTVRDLLDRGIPGEVIRFVLLSTHYRQPMDFSETKVAEAEATLMKWGSVAETSKKFALPSGDVEAILADDLNTPGAMAVLHDLATSGDPDVFVPSARLLGLLTPELGGWRDRQLGPKARRTVHDLLKIRAEAKARRDYVMADNIRQVLSDAGISVIDEGNGQRIKANFFHPMAWFANLSEQEKIQVLPEIGSGKSIGGDRVTETYYERQLGPLLRSFS